NEQESAWARLAAPMAGPDRGLFLVPEVDDEVLVAFVDGDINSPVIIGSLWNGSDLPPEVAQAVAGGKVERRIFRTRAGHVLAFDDTAGSEQIELVAHSGRDRVIINSATSTITIESGANITIHAASALKLEGATVEVTASGSVRIR